MIHEQKDRICNFCGAHNFETRRIEYLYSHNGE